MRIHAVGVGALGSLVSFHVRRTARLLASNIYNLRTLPNQSAVRHLPEPDDVGVTLRLRRSNFLKKAQDEESQVANRTSITVESKGVRNREDGVGIQWSGSLDSLGNKAVRDSASTVMALNSLEEGMPGSSICEQLGYPAGSIDVCLVTTRPQNTLLALEPLVSSLTPASTLILLQSGQGVLDQLVKKLFPDPQRRPNIVLGTSTHETAMRGRMHVAHNRQGRIDLGVVPNANIGANYERWWSPRESVMSSISDDTAPRIRDSGKESDIDPFFDDRPAAPKPVYDKFLYASQRASSSGQQERRMAHQLSIPTAPTLDLGAIPQNSNTVTLVRSLAMLLSLPLNVNWTPIRKYQFISLKRLVVNACIEPVTALASCRNGDMYANKHAEHALRDICSEASAVLTALAHRTHSEALARQQATQDAALADDWQQSNGSDYLFSPDSLISDPISTTAPVLHASLQPGALYEEVQRTIRRTAPRFSTMYEELHENRQRSAPHTTEIMQTNGYLGRLGRSLGVATPVNDFITSMILFKGGRRSTSAWPTQV
jgi:2-dehydropantoate 2-reductase